MKVASQKRKQEEKNAPTNTNTASNTFEPVVRYSLKWLNTVDCFVT